MPGQPPPFAAIRVLDLATAQQLALAANPSMEAALARVEQARARVQEAQAAWWPSLDLTGSGSRVRQSESAWEMSQALYRLFGQQPDRTTEEYAAGLRASWLLFDGYFRKFNEAQAGYGQESSQAGRQNVQRLLAEAVAEAFLNAQLSQANAGISGADRDFYRQQLQDAQSRFDAGAGLWGDVLNIRVQLNTAQSNFLFASREFEVASYGLAALLGLPEAKFPARMGLSPLRLDTDVSAPAAPPEQLIEEALGRRPDIRQLALAVKQAEAEIGMANAQFYPQLQLSGAVNDLREGDFRLAGDDVGNAVSLNLSWNLFAGGVDRARRFAAQQSRREADAMLRNLRQQVAAEVRQDLALLEAAREQVLLQRESVQLVEQNRDLARSEYEAGQASLLRLNEAQRDLTTTHGRLALAQVAWERARERLLSAIGRNVSMIEEKGRQTGGR